MQKPRGTPLQKSSFHSPPGEFWPAAYWFWDHNPGRDEIRAQLEQLQAAGFRLFFIQPRLSYPLEDYLGEAYLDAYREALLQARRLGLQAGLYDDYNWISGHAGGRTVRGRPDLCERQLFWSAAPCGAQESACTISGIRSLMAEGLGQAAWGWLYDGGAMAWESWELAYAAYLPCRAGQVDLARRVEVTAQCSLAPLAEGGCRVVCRQPHPGGAGDGEAWKLVAFAAARCTTSRMIDYLNPAAVARFIEVGLEPYARKVGDLFGGPLSLLFFDQPYAGFYTWNERCGAPRNSLMYSDGPGGLLEALRQALGGDPWPALLGLVEECGEQTARLRCDFFATYGELARRTFFAPLREWAHAHRLVFTGHELLSFVGAWGFTGGLEDFDSRVNFGADYAAVASYKDLSAVDAFGSRPQVSARLGHSLAAAHGGSRCLLEQYYSASRRGKPAPAGAWELSLEEVRSQALRHTLQGCRQFIFHAFYASDRADAALSPLRSLRFDFPPGINYQPWFRHHVQFATELARLSSFLEQGEPLAALGVVYPLRSFWHAGSAASFSAESAAWMRGLSEGGIPFEVIDEAQLLSGQVEGGRLRIGGRELCGVALPGMEVVQGEATLKRLEALAEAGVLVLASGALPQQAQDGSAAAVRARAGRLFGGRENVHVLESAAGPQGLAGLEGVLQQRLPVYPRLEWDGGEDELHWLWAARDERFTYLSVFNDAPGPRRFRLRLPGSWQAERWYPEDGGVRRWGWLSEAAGETRVMLDLEAGQAACLRLERGREGLPALVESELRVLEARRGVRGGLRVSLRADRSGEHVLRIASKGQPRVEGCRLQADQGPGEAWTLRLQVPGLPPALRLEHGWTFRPGEAGEPCPVDITRGWESQGWDNFTGCGEYFLAFSLPPSPFQGEGPGVRVLLLSWELVFPAVACTAQVWLNGRELGTRLGQEYRFPLPPRLLKRRDNRLQVRVCSSAANAYYPGTPYAQDALTPCGISGAPLIRPYFRIQAAVDAPEILMEEKP